MKKNLYQKYASGRCQKWIIHQKNMHNTIEFNYFRLMAEGVAIMLIEKWEISSFTS